MSAHASALDYNPSGVHIKKRSVTFLTYLVYHVDLRIIWRRYNWLYEGQHGFIEGFFVVLRKLWE